MPSLTFNNADKYFYLHGHSDKYGMWKTVCDWEVVQPGILRTADLKAAARFRSDADEICEGVFTRAFNQEFVGTPLLPQLRFLDPHQWEGVRWIMTRKRSYLAHAPGAGKSAQAIVAGCLIRDPGHVVITCPPDLTYNWEREIEKFSTHFRPFYTIGRVGTSANKKSVAWNASFLIVPDSMLYKPWVYDRLKLLPTKLLVVDEASRFKDSNSTRAKALFGGRTKYRTYAGLAQAARRCVLLDGSPMPNRPMELWAPVYALDPEAIDCMNQYDFGFKYCGAQMNAFGKWEFKHSSNEAELRERLRRRFMHVVGEEGLKHPERRRSLLFMNQDTRTPAMKAWEKKNLKLLRTDDLTEDLSQGEIATHRKLLGLSKIPWVSRYILGRLDDKREQVLVFAWHREVCTGLAQELTRKCKPGEVGLVMGGTPKDLRERVFDGFQKGQIKVIIGNIAAMGRGHNLQRADRVVFCEPSWSDESNKQGEKRASRRGRDEAAFVRCEYVVVPGSLDERIMTALFAKAQRVRKVIG